MDAAAVLASHTPRMLVFAGDVGGPWVCSVDWTAWRGDDATGGCEAVLLARRVIDMEESIAAAWESTKAACAPVAADTALKVMGGLYDRAAAERDAAMRRAALRLNVGLTDASDTADILAVLDDLYAAEASVALLEGLLREAVDVLASVDGDGHRLKDRIEAVLADGG